MGEFVECVSYDGETASDAAEKGSEGEDFSYEFHLGLHFFFDLETDFALVAERIALADLPALKSKAAAPIGAVAEPA